LSEPDANYDSRHLQPVTALPSVGPKTAVQLARKGIETISDLLYFLPVKYDDRRVIVSVAELPEGETATVSGVLERIRVLGGRGRARRTVARLVDETGELAVTWFGFGGREFSEGDRVVLTGVVSVYQDKPQLANPDGVVFTDGPAPVRIVPIYSETEGVRQRTWRKLIVAAMDAVGGDLAECVPEAVREKYGLLQRSQALRLLHFPPADWAGPPAALLDHRCPPRASLVFDELFAFQLGMALRRDKLASGEGIDFDTDGPIVAPLLTRLPFQLTPGQAATWADIAADMAQPHPMHRLVHGDVASGKTVLAMLAAFAAAKNGYQAAVLAPTEVLAEQHAQRFTNLFEPLGVRVALATGTVKGTARRRLADRIALGVEHVVIGTHALFSGDIDFSQLGLVVIDEQHKFGVDQRATLIGKGDNPDVLVLTATPIPRSLALTLYGDLDVTMLPDKPGGAGSVTTQLRRQCERPAVYAAVAAQVAKGMQCFVVCPRLEVGDETRADVISLVAELENGPLAGLRLASLHGRMQTEARLQIVAAFARGEIDVLVATSVIEVGVDVPNASVLVVENAESFGLSQLHQLRGRIGRDGREAQCFLVYPDGLSEPARERLSFLTTCTDGFAISEKDLELRGPGELLGTRQAGLPRLRFAAEAMADLARLVAARDTARDLLDADPELCADRNKSVRMVVNERWGSLLGEGRYG
jgi:ATP-dependent DNA helicase RecG